MLLILVLVSLVLSALPAILFLDNLRQYRVPARPVGAGLPGVSVLIPARNEEATIRAALDAALASEGVAFEVVVLDDHSTDLTRAIVLEVASRDARVSLQDAPPLPEGWCGKQHACHVLSTHARHSLLLFLDADVRIAPDGLARAVGFLENSGADLVSGIPRQTTGSLIEAMVIPLIHFVLLGFLPMRRMRLSGDPSYAAGCGQLFLARKQAYDAMGGHATIRSTLHDGIKLPRAFRTAGLKTDLFDATSVATCRMYQSASDLWFGLAKNATEGLASPALIVPTTLLLLGGQILPFVLLLFATSGAARALALIAVGFAYMPRLAGVLRFRQPALGALLHPLGCVILLAIQWFAVLRGFAGSPASWKGRPYPALTKERA